MIHTYRFFPKNTFNILSRPRSSMQEWPYSVHLNSHSPPILQRTLPSSSQPLLLPLCIVIGIGCHLSNLILPGVDVNYMKKRKTKTAIVLRFAGKWMMLAVNDHMPHAPIIGILESAEHDISKDCAPGVLTIQVAAHEKGYTA